MVLPSPPSVAGQQKSGKLAMKGQVHQWLEERHLGWSPDSVDCAGKNFLNGFTEVLWYIDGHEGTLASFGCGIPQDFHVLLGYNQPEKSKHRRKDVTNLSCDVLHHHISTLNHFLLQSWIKSAPWLPIKELLSQLTTSLLKYVAYMKNKNAEMKRNHAMSQPVRNIDDSVSYTSIQPAVWVKPSLAKQYAALEATLLAKDYFCPVFVNDFAPAESR